MARQARLVVPGQAHYLIQRGNNAQAVFVDDEDRRHYLGALQEAARRHAVAAHAYTLLDNAVHLLVTPTQGEDLSRMVQAIGRTYVRTFNRRHGRSGTLWEGRFRGAVVAPGEAELRCLLTIDALAHPVEDEHGITWPAWSSAAHHLGRRRELFLADPQSYWQLGNTPYAREAAYGALLERALGDDSRAATLSASAARGWPIGDEAFLAELAGAAARPVRPRKRGRPRLRIV